MLKQTQIRLCSGLKFGNFATTERFVFFFCLLKLFIGNNLVRIKRKPLFYPARIPIIHIHFGKQPFPADALFFIEIKRTVGAQLKIALPHKPAGKLLAHLADNVGKLAVDVPKTGRTDMVCRAPVIGSPVITLRCADAIVQNTETFVPV